MMMFWILCLLIGSITCTPVLKVVPDYGSQTAPSAASEPVEVPLPYHPGTWRRVTSDMGSSSFKPGLPNPSSDKIPEISSPATSSTGPASHGSGTNMAGGSGLNSGYAGFRNEAYNSPEVSEYGAYAASLTGGYDSSAPSGSYIGGYGGYASVYDGSAPSGGYGGYAGSSSYGYMVSPQDEASSSGSAGAENPEPVFSDVSDLEPVYSFSSRSSYQRGRSVFAQTRYIPGELAPPAMPVSRDVSKISKQSSSAKAPAKGGF
ncbi:uncharacterized protein [Trachinotus anak]|uniref:uncharacterized protein isoform X1 n=1 Tax=Trachinotus anak TaxID=443729 RepID=UPI0039F22351